MADDMEGKQTLCPLRLTAPQKRHLSEMVGPDGRTLYWHPSGSAEERCARTLRKKGLLDGSSVTSNDAYYLSPHGLRAAKALIAGEDYSDV